LAQSHAVHLLLDFVKMNLYIIITIVAIASTTWHTTNKTQNNNTKVQLNNQSTKARPT